MKLKFDYNNMMVDAIGDKGICPCVFDKKAQSISDAYNKVMTGRGKGWQEWADLPYVSDEYLDEMISYCSAVQKKADSFVVFGIGGSALGPLARSFTFTITNFPKKYAKRPSFTLRTTLIPRE